MYYTVQSKLSTLLEATFQRLLRLEFAFETTKTSALVFSELGKTPLKQILWFLVLTLLFYNFAAKQFI